MTLKSEPVVRAKVKGKKYCDTIRNNAGENSEYFVSEDKPKVYVTGKKYKVSNHRLPGYARPDQM